jgi:hypothetical protein
MRKAESAFKVGTEGKEIVWGLKPPKDASSSSPAHREDEEDEAPDGVVTDTAGLAKLVEAVLSADRGALDLETMPPPGWKAEVLSEYAEQLARLKSRPKISTRKTRLVKIKEATYKRYATDTDAAFPRIASVATEDTNVLVDVTKVDLAPLLDVIKDKTLVTHNGVFDLGVLRSRYGYVHEGRTLDTQLLYTLYHYAKSGERSKKANGMWRLPDPRDTKVDLFGTGKKDVGMTALANVVHEHLDILMDKASQKSDWSRPRLSTEQVRYALEDTSILLDLVDTLLEKLHKVGMGDIVELESRAFTALVADFSQVELLIAGTIAARETGKRGYMLEVFQKGEADVHTATAASLAGKAPADVPRPNAASPRPSTSASCAAPRPPRSWNTPRATTASTCRSSRPRRTERHSSSATPNWPPGTNW